MITHSILVWEIPGTVGLAGYSPWGPRRVRHDLATKLNINTVLFLKEQKIVKVSSRRNITLFKGVGVVLKES